MDKYDLAKALFGGGQQSQEAGSTTVLYGRAAGDSANGRVDVSLNGVTYAAEGANPSIQMDTTTDVRAGETVIVTVVDGHPVVTGVVGSGDRLRTDVDAAAGVADLAQQDVTKAQSDIDQFKKDAEATYSTKTETDEKTNAVKETIEAAYLKKDDASTTYATKTELSKSADGIRSEVSEEYVTKDDAAKAYVGKSTFEQDARAIATTVTSELTTGWTAWADDSTGRNMVLGDTYPSSATDPGDASHPLDVDGMAFRGSAKVLSDAQPTDAASYDWVPNPTATMRSEVRQTADAITSTVAAGYATKGEVSEVSTRVTQTASRVDTAITDVDGLSTLIREDSSGITVGKSTDGKTYSTGRTHIGTNSFDILDKAGKVLSSFGKDKVKLGVDGAQIDMAGGRLLIDAQDHAASEMPSGLPTTITRIICPSSNSGKNDTEMYLGAYDKDSGNVVGGMNIRVTRETDGSYNTSAGIIGSFSAGSMGLVTPLPVESGGTGATSIDAARRNLHISQGSKVCYGHGTPWVTLFESWSEFKQATGCYDSGLPTLVTMNGDWGAFDGALSDCEIKGGEAVYVMARTTDGPHTLYGSNSVRINWICIW